MVSGQACGRKAWKQRVSRCRKVLATNRAISPSLALQVVEPKIAKLRESEAELKVATRERQAVEEELAVVQTRLDAMQAQFDAAMAQKQVGGRRREAPHSD